MGKGKLFSDKLRLYQSILDSTIDGVVVVDADYTILYVNRAIEVWSGLKRKDMVGKKCMDVAPQLNCEEVCPPKMTFDDGKPHVVENVLTTSMIRVCLWRVWR